MRNSSSIVIEDSIIIFDECHNLPSALENITGIQIEKVCKYLDSCLKYVESSNKSRILLINIAKFISRIISVVKGFSESICIFSLEDFLIMTKASDYNISKINSSFNNWLESIDTKDRFMFAQFKNLLGAVQKNSGNAKIILENVGASDFNFSLRVLDNSDVFSDICKRAYGVVLTGGTVSPSETLMINLFKQNEIPSVFFKSFPHVIKSANVKTLILDKIQSTEINFSYANRSLVNVIKIL